MVRVAYDVIKHLIPPEERKKVKKKEPCRVCGELVCRCLQDDFAGQCRLSGFPVLRPEVQFDPTRKWRLDFVFLATDYLLAVEIDGGTFSQGRHTRGAGYEEDCRKINEAQIAGYTVLRFTGAMVKSGEALDQTEHALRAFGWRKENP